MGLIHEEVTHPEFENVELMIIQREAGECVEPWRIAELSINHRRERFSPKELRELGHWLIAEGKRLGREYKSNGAPKQATA